MAQAQMIFPADFRWGTATAAYQVEGHNTNSDWWTWEQTDGRILHNHKSGPASNWWTDAETDLNTAMEMGTNAHRLSLEWSRIEPQPSAFDNDALDRYREILQAMHNRGIEPMVTLHHFSNPLWLTEKGDFSSQIVVEYFQRYTAKVVNTLGDLIPKWITINEPMVYVFMRYLIGTFPVPQKSGLWAGMEAVKHMLMCHATAYHTIKEIYPQAEVGVAKNFPVFQARPGSRFPSKWWANFVSSLFNDLWMETMVNGRMRSLIGSTKIPHLAGAFDFVGVNYYTRYYTKFPPRGGFYDLDWGPDAVVSDGNYGEIYPQGLFQVIKQVLKYNKPIYITENGLPDAADKLRPSFILTHLHQIWKAINFCWPVMGYYHWSLVDNFEWDRGWTQRFGLIELDPETQERRLRRSGQLYGEICHSGRISSDMAARYAPELLATMFLGETLKKDTYLVD
ncbi:MAG: glycoside hydrolase family 1 protein [Chloroflexi bacterium]|nr:glycoside hydrolase family 1 protein [Chloroflexota bacterium]